MKVYSTLKFSLFICTCITFWGGKFGAMAQTITGQSPLSRYGLGNEFNLGLSRNEAMGSTGIATPSQDHTNLSNPALMTYTEKVNFEMDLRYTYRELTVSNSYTYSGGGGGPALFSLTLPVHKRVTVAFGIRPFTNRDFIFTQQKTIGGDSIQYISHGSGGTSKAFLSTGVSLSPKIKIGLEVGYVFGTIEDSLRFGSLPLSSNFNFISLQKRRVSQIVFKPGIHFRHPLKGRENTFLAVGMTADLSGKFGYKNYQTFNIKGAGNQAETLDNGTSSTLNHATRYSIGLGYYKTLSWSLNAEFDYLKTGQTNDGETDMVYKDGFGLRLGGEISPGTQKSTRYFNIITFRAGASYTQLPYSLDGKSAVNQSLSFGASFPIIRKEAKFTRPIINLAVAYGQKGIKETSVGMENYWQVTLGFTLNDFLWFNRYRID